MSLAGPKSQADNFPLSFSKDPERLEALLIRLEEWATHPAAADLANLEFTLVKEGPEANLFEQTEFPLHKDQQFPVRHFRGMTTSKWDYCKTGCKHFDLRARRPPPAAFTTATATVTLKSALWAGPDLESQVYKGTLRPGPFSGGRAVDVAVKIYQMSRMAPIERLRKWVLCTLESDIPYSKLMHGFRVESYAYRYMAPIQGSYVPHVYGFFKIVLPNGEPCIALVTEYIAGTPLTQFVADRAGRAEELLPIVGKAVASAVHALNMCMVGIRDWHPSNFIVTNENEGSGNVEPEIVIVDFDQARPVHRSHRTHMLCQVNSLLEEVGFEKDAVDDWIGECVDPNSKTFAPAENPYITAFDIDTVNLNVMRRLVGINPGRRIVS